MLSRLAPCPLPHPYLVCRIHFFEATEFGKQNLYNQQKSVSLNSNPVFKELSSPPRTWINTIEEIVYLHLQKSVHHFYGNKDSSVSIAFRCGRAGCPVFCVIVSSPDHIQYGLPGLPLLDHESFVYFILAR